MQQSRTFSNRSGAGGSDDASLSTWLRERIKTLQAALDRTAAALRLNATSKRIHEVRIAARQLRALLYAFRRDLDPRSVGHYRQTLRALTLDLEAAREADVTRRAIVQLQKEGCAGIRIEADALRGGVADRYSSAVHRLRTGVGAASWRRRVSSLQRLSIRASLVPLNGEPAAIAVNRRVNRARRRLRLALRRAGKNVKRLHRLRLRVKHIRYLLEDDIGAKTPLAADSELKCLRRLQDCLGDIHDEENLRDSLRARGMPHRATHGIVEELRRRKRGHFKEFKKCRKDLMKRWRDVI